MKSPAVSKRGDCLWLVAFVCDVGAMDKMHAVVTERNDHTHLLYLECLFCVEHAVQQLEQEEQFGNKSKCMEFLPVYDRGVFAEQQQRQSHGILASL